MVTRKRFYFESCNLLALAGIPYKYNQCRTTLGGFSSVCAKVEPASSKNNEILEINVPTEIYIPCSLSGASVFEDL